MSLVVIETALVLVDKPMRTTGSPAIEIYAASAAEMVGINKTEIIKANIRRANITINFNTGESKIEKKFKQDEQDEQDKKFVKFKIRVLF